MSMFLTFSGEPPSRSPITPSVVSSIRIMHIKARHQNEYHRVSYAASQEDHDMEVTAQNHSSIADTEANTPSASLLHAPMSSSLHSTCTQSSVTYAHHPEPQNHGLPLKEVGNFRAKITFAFCTRVRMGFLASLALRRTFCH